MMNIIFPIHIISVSIFLLLLLIKSFLVLSNRKQGFDKIQSMFKIPDMINSAIFLLTGIYMLVQIGMGNIGGWFHLKLTLVVIGIPMGIIAFKRGSKVLVLLTCLLYLYVYGVSETKSATLGIGAKKVEDVITDTKASGYDMVKHGESIFLSKCIQCHGEDGKKGLMGAPDLTTSQLSTEEIISLVKNGKNGMNSFSSQLSDEEITAVAHYADQLSK